MSNVGLELDETITPRVRLRRWRHRGARVPRWPSAAHDTVEVAWAERGGMRYRVGSRELCVAVGEVVIVPSEVEHQTVIAPGTAATSIQLSTAAIAETQEIVGGAIGFDVVSDGGIISLAQLILAEARQPRRGSFLTTEALAEALSVRLLRSGHPAMSTGDPRIARAVREMEERYAEPLTIDELAKTAGMSRYHFSRTFRRQMGKSPYQFLTATRVRRAAELLRKRRHSVTEVAFCVGIFDLGRFARAFRKEMGCAPSRYGSATIAC